MIHAIHRMGFLHRDISTSNVLLTPNQDVKVIDFGISVSGLVAGNRAGSVAFMSPEVLGRKKYSTEVDWWSYGIVLMCLVQGQTPLKAHTTNNQTNYHDIPTQQRCS